MLPHFEVQNQESTLCYQPRGQVLEEGSFPLAAEQNHPIVARWQ